MVGVMRIPRTVHADAIAVAKSIVDLVVRDHNADQYRCPEDRSGAPCPLFGGDVPNLEWGPTAPYGVADMLAGAPGRDPSLLRFGTCEVCRAMIVCDAAGNPLRARR